MTKIDARWIPASIVFTMLVYWGFTEFERPPEFERPLEKFCIEDAQSIMRTKLRPIMKQEYRGSTNASIWLWSDGDVNIDVTLAGGSKLESTGKNLNEAMHNMDTQLDGALKQIRKPDHD